MNSTSSQRMLIAVQSGWQSTKANVIPGSVIVFLASLLVTGQGHRGWRSAINSNSVAGQKE